MVSCLLDMLLCVLRLSVLLCMLRQQMQHTQQHDEAPYSPAKGG
jgi:hypothetical protein